jgi:hypothetical protein
MNKVKLTFKKANGEVSTRIVFWERSDYCLTGNRIARVKLDSGEYRSVIVDNIVACEIVL